ncbi:MAG: efflux RND transporter periplasmic adaptor subunit [Verrucomicrobia bacterium]|nr:efflux RND transporter periplasmic adaptor subunit [Verrucomicrobiota bacterium]
MKSLKSFVRVKSVVLAVAGVALAVAIAGCKKGATQGGGGFFGGPPEVGVFVVNPERVTLTTELPGRIAASLVAEVRPQVTGIIQKRFFEEGAQVSEGDLLYQIDPAIYEAAQASAKAALARTEANLTSLRAQLKRYEELVAIHAVSQQAYDDIDAAVKQAEAERVANQAALDSARINLDYTKIKAPISGRIGKSEVTVGALVTANQAASLAVIQQLDPVYVDAPQTSANYLRLKQNIAAGHVVRADADAAARLIFEDGSSYAVAGALKFADVTVNPTTGSLTLRSSFPNPDGLLLPGMYVRVVVDEGVREQAIVVPQRGVTFNARGKAVATVVGEEDKAEVSVLEIDRALGDLWLVNSGLQAGDRVIVEGIQRVQPGSPVVPVPFGQAREADGASAAEAAPVEPASAE